MVTAMAMLATATATAMAMAILVTATATAILVTVMVMVTGTATPVTMTTTRTGTGTGDENPGTADCDGKIYQCGDGIDNDGDGLIDGNDPECTSVCDDDETTFGTGIPGDNMDCKQDCFFDGNSGSRATTAASGIFKLRSRESPREHINCEYTGGNGCEDMEGPSEECLESCMWMVPNGCDCFGCCTVFLPGGGSVDVYLGSGGDCSLENLDACNECTINNDCDNPCEPEECEVCIGDVIYPEDCDDDGDDDDAGDDDDGSTGDDDDDDDDNNGCPEGVQACETQADCDMPDAYCFQGCCRVDPVE